MLIKSYLETAARGMEVVESMSQASAPELISWGASPPLAKELLNLFDTYFGSTRFSRKQAAARTAGHSLSVLQLIESHVAKIKNAAKAWDLRVALCAAPVDEFASLVKAATQEQGPANPERGMRLTRRPEGLNHTLSFTGSSLEIAELKAAVESINKQDPVDAAAQSLLGGAKGQAMAVETTVIVEVDDLAEILRGQGDDTVLRLSNGAQMTGKQYLDRRLGDRMLFVLTSRVHGPVDLYRAERFASAKQRSLLAAHYSNCVWPDCLCPVDEAQFHHLHSWKSGGWTNLDNLIPLCAYHNGINDDDAAGGHRGRIARVAGKIAWIPPFGGAPRFVQAWMG